MPKDGSQCESSSDRKPDSSADGAGPGTSSYAIPAMPSSAKRGISSNGNSARSQQRFAIGATSAASQSRTRCRTSRSGPGRSRSNR